MSFSLYGSDLNELLEVYKKQSDLSNVTKQESAGDLTLFTRDMLEKMQARNLEDILKTVPGIYTYRSANNLTFITPPTLLRIPLTSARLYINDHDMTSTSFGSAFLIWGKMPIEYIDHIEVYKTSSSIEFGNETAVLVIKLYTKQATRDSGNKLRVVADHKGSLDFNTYSSDILDNGFSYFVYANGSDTKREPYYNTYQSKEYTFKSDYENYELYADLRYKSSQLEIGTVHNRSDSFVGIGIHKTPTDGELDANHFYAHFTQNFDYDIKLELAYDNLEYERTYVDPNGIRISNPMNPPSGRGVIKDYTIAFEDEVYSAILEKRLRYGKHFLLLGAFYKHKEMTQNGHFDTIETPKVNNGLNLYSVYAEEQYDFNPTTRFVFMAKGDFYRYDKVVDSADESVVRAGVIKNFGDFHFKVFYTDTYMPNSFYMLYNPTNIPYKSNPHLKHIDVDSLSGSVEYIQEKWDAKLFLASNNVHNSITYKRGYANSSKTMHSERFELSGHYRFDTKNTLFGSFFSADNGTDVLKSPKYGATLRMDNTVGKADIYNEVLYTSSYTDSQSKIYLPSTFNWTFAWKYHYSKDFSFGLRGENLLDKSCNVAYRDYDTPIPSFDRKLWVNLEYLF